MRLTIVSTSDFFSDYGGGEVYVKSVVDELINRKESLRLELSVISNNNQGTKEYRGIPILSSHDEESFRTILKQFGPDIIHANGLFEFAIPLGHEMRIPVISTVHDAMFICPVYTLLDEKEVLCRRSMEFHRCLKCSLYRQKGCRLLFPLTKKLSQERLSKWGKAAENKPFIFFYTPTVMSALGVHRKIEYWRNYLCQSDIMILPSNSMTQRVIQNGMKREKTITIPNGINAPREIANPPTTKNGIDFYYIGRVSYSKGVHVLLSAFHKLSSKNIRLHIIGLTEHDTHDAFVCKLRRKYLNDERIQWHKKVPHENIFYYLKEYHVMVHPSIANETFSLTVAEAKAMGKWVIATRCGGPEEQISDGNNGSLVNINDVKALTEAMQSFIDNPKHPKPAPYMSIEQHVDILLDTFNSIINNRSESSYLYHSRG